jgi:hypothetical protein
VTQGLECYGVLKAKGVPARLVYFPDENHWVLKPRNSLLWYREVHAWLARWSAGLVLGGARLLRQLARRYDRRQESSDKPQCPCTPPILASPPSSFALAGEKAEVGRVPSYTGGRIARSPCEQHGALTLASGGQPRTSAKFDPRPPLTYMETHG